jgi:hypothetical protein
VRCDEFEFRLNEVLDERRAWASDAELTAHGRSCPACRDMAASYDAALRALVASAADAGDASPIRQRAASTGDLAARILAARVLAELTAAPATPARPTPRISRRYQYALAMAASVLLALGVRWATLRTAPTAPASAGADASAGVDVAQRVAPLHAKRVASQIPPKRLVAKQTSSPTAGDGTRLESLLGARSSLGAQWAHRMADGLDPVTRPTVGALSGFLELWGVDEQRPRS